MLRSIDNVREKLYATQPELKIVLKEMHLKNELIIPAPRKETYLAFQDTATMRSKFRLAMLLI